VIKKSEYEALKKDKNDYKQRFESSDKRFEQLVRTSAEALEKKHQYWESKCKEIGDVASKETAREIANKIYNKLTERDVWREMIKFWSLWNGECYELKSVINRVLKENGIELE
jgi:thioredoxin-like negative regulator of GroEL